MDKRGLKNVVLFLAFIIYIVLYKLYIFPNFMRYSEVISASFMVVLLAVSIKWLGFRRDKMTVLSKTVLRIVIFYLFLAFFVMYGLGIFVGFLKNAYSRNFFTLIDNIFAPIVIIILTELFRYVVIWANRDRKRVIVILTILLIAFEICFNVKAVDFVDLRTIFNTSATILLPIIIKNIVLSYFSYHVGYKIPILYRLIMEIYVFIVPYIPDIGNYLNSMILISLPILIYISSFALIDNRVTKPEPVFYRNEFTIFDGVTAALLLTLVALISGLFPHFMIGIGSESMVPAIAKGDAVILQKVTERTILKENDIIAYGKDKVIVVHRIVKVHKNDDGTVTYVTKGDANNGNDAKEVTRGQVKGVVKLRIPYIAYPTVWLSEIFNR